MTASERETLRDNPLRNGCERIESGRRVRRERELPNSEWTTKSSINWWRKSLVVAENAVETGRRVGKKYLCLLFTTKRQEEKLSFNGLLIGKKCSYPACITRTSRVAGGNRFAHSTMDGYLVFGSLTPSLARTTIGKQAPSDARGREGRVLRSAGGTEGGSHFFPADRLHYTSTGS